MTTKIRSRIPTRLFILIVLVFAVLFIFQYGLNQVSSSNTKEHRQIIETAIYKNITECYALEGFYPPSLQYMQVHYGLNYNESIYFVDYQYIGANILPNVTILPRGTTNQKEEEND